MTRHSLGFVASRAMAVYFASSFFENLYGVWMWSLAERAARDEKNLGTGAFPMLIYAFVHLGFAVALWLGASHFGGPKEPESPNEEVRERAQRRTLFALLGSLLLVWGAADLLWIGYWVSTRQTISPLNSFDVRNQTLIQGLLYVVVGLCFTLMNQAPVE